MVSPLCLSIRPGRNDGRAFLSRHKRHLTNGCTKARASTATARFQWLETQLGITTTYKTVHQLVHYRLKALPKVARPVSVVNSEEQVEAYKKTR
ncbi:hypothetical protein [Leptolyngbya sp. FACHB-321]|uniref:hypothetical protein n=1 Tax=Leptolyngbya sp. FACHB-321 TaxID=2692807 RepID=UPI001A7E473B|nr:hypothetical protein [Leptolyngbya sp. FACHB-321]